MSFRLVPKSVTLNDLERRNGRYIALFHCIWSTCVPTHNRVDLWRNLCTSLLYFVVRVRCRRKESSRSLSHLLMRFLYALPSLLSLLRHGCRCSRCENSPLWWLCLVHAHTPCNAHNVNVAATPKTNSAFHPSGVGKWVPASAGKANSGMVHSVSGCSLRGVCR